MGNFYVFIIKVWFNAVLLFSNRFFAAAFRKVDNFEVAIFKVWVRCCWAQRRFRFCIVVSKSAVSSLLLVAPKCRKSNYDVKMQNSKGPDNLFGSPTGGAPKM